MAHIENMRCYIHSILYMLLFILSLLMQIGCISIDTSLLLPFTSIASTNLPFTSIAFTNSPHKISKLVEIALYFWFKAGMKSSISPYQARYISTCIQHVTKYEHFNDDDDGKEWKRRMLRRKQKNKQTNIMINKLQLQRLHLQQEQKENDE